MTDFCGLDTTSGRVHPSISREFRSLFAYNISQNVISGQSHRRLLFSRKPCSLRLYEGRERERFVRNFSRGSDVRSTFRKNCRTFESDSIKFAPTVTILPQRRFAHSHSRRENVKLDHQTQADYFFFTISSSHF